jgi:5-methylcytosine-specific restriction endonuclease McrA
MKRSEVFARDGHLCVYCGEGPPEVELTVDHVEPRMRGGDNSSGNLVTACVACNRSKGGLPAWAWLQDREEERVRFLTRATYVWPRLRAAVREAAGKGVG